MQKANTSTATIKKSPRKNLWFKILLGTVGFVLVTAFILFGYLYWDKNLNPVVAKVDGESITRVALNERYATLTSLYKNTEQEKRSKEEIECEAKKRLIEEKRVEVEAEKRDIQVTEDEVLERYRKKIDELDKSEDFFLKQISGGYGQTKEQYLEYLRKEILKDKVQTKVLRQYDLLYIMVRYDRSLPDGKDTPDPQGDKIAKEKIDEIRQRLINGEKMEDIGTELQSDPKWVHPQSSISYLLDMNKERLDSRMPYAGEDWEEIKKLNKVGEYTPVVKNPEGFYVIYRANAVATGEGAGWGSYIQDDYEKNHLDCEGKNITFFEGARNLFIKNTLAACPTNNPMPTGARTPGNTAFSIYDYYYDTMTLNTSVRVEFQDCLDWTCPWPSHCTPNGTHYNSGWNATTNGYYILPTNALYCAFAYYNDASVQPGYQARGVKAADGVSLNADAWRTTISNREGAGTPMISVVLKPLNNSGFSNGYFYFSKVIHAYYDKNTTDAVGNMPAIGNYYLYDTGTIPSNIPTRNGYTFQGWKDSAGTPWSAGSQFALTTESVTFYAQWTLNPVATLRTAINPPTGTGLTPAADQDVITTGGSAQAIASYTGTLASGYTAMNPLWTSSNPSYSCPTVTFPQGSTDLVICTANFSYTPPTNPACSITLTANPTVVNPGGSSTLSWSSPNNSVASVTATWTTKTTIPDQAGINNITAPTNYTITGIGAAGYSNCSASANVSINTSEYLLTVQKGGTGTGTFQLIDLDHEPDYAYPSCDPSCSTRSYSYDTSRHLRLVATPSAGSVFKEFDFSAWKNTSPTADFTLNSNRTVIVIFNAVNAAPSITLISPENQSTQRPASALTLTARSADAEGDQVETYISYRKSTWIDPSLPNGRSDDVCAPPQTGAPGDRTCTTVENIATDFENGYGPGIYYWQARVRSSSSSPWIPSALWQFEIPPTCSLNPSPSSIASGGSSQISWETSDNSTQISANSPAGWMTTQTVATPQRITGSTNVSPSDTTTYVMNVTGLYPTSSNTCQTQVFVTYPQISCSVQPTSGKLPLTVIVSGSGIPETTGYSFLEAVGPTRDSIDTSNPASFTEIKANSGPSFYYPISSAYPGWHVFKIVHTDSRYGEGICQARYYYSNTDDSGGEVTR